MYFLTYFLVIVSIIALTSKSQARKTSKLPPGPNGLPIIGNILDLGFKPHRSLTKLSRIYGPVISLKLGTITTVVVSSPETTKAVLQTHDLSFSSRPIPSAMRALNHHEFSMSWLPVGKQWRKLRKICREQMFSAARLDAGQDLRRNKLHDYVSECSETGWAVDVGEAAFTTSLNLLGSTIFSTDLAGFGSDSSQEFKDAVWGAMKCGGTPNLADYFPVLKSVDPQRIFKQSTIYFGKLLAIFGEIIDERLKSGSQKIDFIGALIGLHQRDEPHLSREDINHLLLVLFIAGTDTTFVTIDWAMAEVMRNPEKMTRVRNEIKVVKQENGQIQESDIPRFPYLQAVVKETFRLHPPAPLLLPHKAESDVKVNGFTVPQTRKLLSTCGRAAETLISGRMQMSSSQRDS